MDRHSVTGAPVPAPQLRLSLLFRHLIRSASLFDLWRINHPDWSFSFYSNPHRLHTRIDYFFGNLPMVRMLSGASLEPISWSDHCPVLLSFSPTSTSPRRCHWRLNDSLLKSPSSRDAIQAHILEYFSHNEGSVSSHAILWEAHKSVVRGHCIALASRLKRDALARSRDLRAQIASLESLLLTSPSLGVLRSLVAVRSQLADLALHKVERQLLYVKQRFYEKGNKAHTLLARRLRDRTAALAPAALRDSSGVLHYHPDAISKLFFDYYSALYSLPSQLPSDPGLRAAELDSFLSQCHLPSLTSADREMLNAPVTSEELSEVLKALPNGRSPGPDGFTYLYYKTYSAILLPRLVPLFNSFLGGDPIPQTFLHSHITLIPKPGKDPQDCSSYRPIALHNSDLKLFSKVLAGHLCMFLPALVHKDQVGFIPCRQGGDNTRHMVDLIDLINRRSEQALVLSLDAEKAFDRLGWPFLFATLQKFGISGNFLTALRGLYSAPTASIKLPHASSPTFPLYNGTRQGCPLSPLVFALCIEPLAALVRGNPDISGIALHDREFKICLFADDVLLTLSKPLLSLPALYRVLHSYGVVSGYKVNLSKSEALPLNLPSSMTSLLRADYSFRWSSSAISYLGISLSSRYSTLYSANFPALFRELRALMEKWRSQYISFFGRIAAVKMTILPKLLYYFETLPVKVPLAALRSFQSAIFKFFWDAKRHRLPMSVMLSRRSMGSLGVPDVAKYYWVAHLRHLMAWATHHAYSKWMELEKLWLAPIHPNTFLWSPAPSPSPHPLLGPMTFSWSPCVVLLLSEVLTVLFLLPLALFLV